MEYSIIVESFTLDEGGAWDRFRRSLRAATSMVAEEGNGEVLVIDVGGMPAIRKLLKEEFPDSRWIEATGLGYDTGKMEAVRNAKGKFVLFLDGDCIPSPGWKDSFLRGLRQGDAVAFGGYTRYEGGFLAAVTSVMDFGFLYPVEPRQLECYAYNNSAFLREALLVTPAKAEYLRCACYLNAQQFKRKGTPVMLVPEARVLHEMQPIIRERTRQGYDTIAACWDDPVLPQAKWLRFHLFSIPLFYAMSVFLDWKRLRIAATTLGFSAWQTFFAIPVFPALRLLDVAGMFRAFFGGRVEKGWGGFLEQRRSAGDLPNPTSEPLRS